MRIGAYLTDKLLRKLGVEAEQLARLCESWSRAVDAPLRDHALPIGYQNGTLIIHTTSAVWASKIRHQHKALRERLRRQAGLEALVELRIRVRPPQTLSQPRRPKGKRPPQRFSRKTAALIRGVARDIDDPTLRAAMERLADNGSRRH